MPLADEVHAPTGGLRLEDYRQVIFDCDGVLVDTNGVKEANIRAATAALCDPATTDRFVDYFVSNNGLPREEKLAWFFGDEALERAILERYNALNRTSVPYVRPDPATTAFVERAARGPAPLYVLSGGDAAEVEALLVNAGLASHFRAILGGPTSKAEHLARLGLSGPTCYFGDSKYDYDVAVEFGLDFVFMSRHTQFAGWEPFFSDKPGVRVACDFRDLNH